ncbi:phage head closure protein [Novosphingobium sp. NPDC080210]|uniref:phage head closure protein n=1 Tax=Novosphingobium sp. NPDC080210 TaxID=3390596 RepID=UPI003D0030E4
MDAGRLRDRVTIYQRSETQEATYGTKTVAWSALATVWAEVQDILPSRAENAANGIDIARRPARIRMRWRSDIDMTMRIEARGQMMRIIAGPVELGNREGIEIVAEHLTTEGQEP